MASFLSATGYAGAAFAALAPLSPSPAASDQFPGPVRVTVVSVHDGDTFLADAHVWPGHIVRVSIRIRGIDAPEMRASCTEERRAAENARTRLAEFLGAPEVVITNIGGGKYYGRVVADVGTGAGSAADLLLEAGLARPYDGGKRQPFCLALHSGTAD